MGSLPASSIVLFPSDDQTKLIRCLKGAATPKGVSTSHARRLMGSTVWCSLMGVRIVPTSHDASTDGGILCFRRYFYSCTGAVFQRSRLAWITARASGSKAESVEAAGAVLCLLRWIPPNSLRHRFESARAGMKGIKTGLMPSVRIRNAANWKHAPLAGSLGLTFIPGFDHFTMAPGGVVTS